MTQRKERGTAVAFAEYGRYDALGLAELVRTGQVSATELLDEALDRVARVNPQINAVIHLMESRARDAIAAGLPGGPFAGVPFLLKDLMTAYAGEPMRCGSRLFRDYVPQADEELTRRYRAAGPGDLRQDQHARTRRLERDRARAVRPDPQSLEPRAHVERLERRIGRCGGSAHRAGRECQRRWRLDPHASLQLRPRRPEAEPRPQSDRAGRARRLVGLHRRTCRHAHRARLRRVARRDLRRLSAAAHEACPARPARTSTRLAVRRRPLRIAFSFDPGLGKTLHAENRRGARAHGPPARRTGSSSSSR